MSRVALAAYRGERKSKSAKVSGTWVDTFTAAIPDDAVVLVSVRDAEAAICDLELRPALQGASVVVERGQVRAMVGGNDNRNFNRVEAPRQMGSTWKPLVYHAAIELGWKPTDLLDNAPGVFPWKGVFYYPGADHAPAPQVSMAWAGVNSENLSSVWLLYHLTDRLTFEQTAHLAAEVDLAQRDGESRDDWQARLEEAGISLSARRAEEAWLFEARQEVLAGIATSSHPDDAIPLQSLLYGWGYTTERRTVEKTPKDRAEKLAMLDHAGVVQRERMAECARQHRVLSDAIARREVPVRTEIPDLRVRVEGDLAEVACGRAPEDYVFPTESALAFLFPEVASDPVAAGVSPAEVDEDEPEEEVSGKKRKRRGDPPPAPKPKPAKAPQAWSAEVATWGQGSRLAAEGDVLVDGRLHLGTLRAVEAAFEARRKDAVDPWDPEVLYRTQDFRVLLGIRYVIALGGQYGIRSDVREGLPLPLGASEISLEEAAAIYDGLVSGVAWDFAAEGLPPQAAPTLLIAEIRDVDGNLLYEAVPEARKVASPETGAMTADILRNVVQHGTGRRAEDAIKAGKVAVPVGGKTGTTNDFRNAAFLGYAPVVGDDGWSLDGAWTIGVYVGYDDNRSMKSGDIVLAGASGALPAWIGAARGLAEYGLLGTPTKGMDEVPVPDGLARADVETATGLAGTGGTVLTRPDAAAAAAVAQVALPPRERAVRRRPAATRR